MFGIFRAWRQVKLVHAVLDKTMPHIQGPDPAKRVADAIVNLQFQIAEIERECERMRRAYEPNRKRMTLVDGSTVVIPSDGRTRFA